MQTSRSARSKTDRLDIRFAGLVARGEPFTADDLTRSGTLTVDEHHTPNGKQSSIGSLFSWASKAGLIEGTGDWVRSTSPHRKGGVIRSWRGTPEGRRWAAERHGRRAPDVDQIQLPFPEESVRAVR